MLDCRFTYADSVIRAAVSFPRSNMLATRVDYCSNNLKQCLKDRTVYCNQTLHQNLHQNLQCLADRDDYCCRWRGLQHCKQNLKWPQGGVCAESTQSPSGYVCECETGYHCTKGCLLPWTGHTCIISPTPAPTPRPTPTPTPAPERRRRRKKTEEEGRRRKE